ncbi:MAG: SDR family NAD(P)-dependent oxidoreductase [Fimbriimonas sp.]
MNIARNLVGEIALVTGSGRGLGRAMVERLAQAGADVIVHDRSNEAPAEFGEYADLVDSANRLRDYSVRVHHVIGDVGSETDVARIREEIFAEIGAPSILVNCAGGDIALRGGKPNPNTGLGIKIEDARALVDRNFIGTLMMCQAFGPVMVERKAGTIVNIASAAAHVGTSPEVVYSSIKAAIVHFTRCLAAELRADGVRVNCVSPGASKSGRFVNTRVTDPVKMGHEQPLDRYCDPIDIANAVAFLASAEASMIHGQVIRVDGGVTLYA